MPDRNPFEETRRAGMNVPQRAFVVPKVVETPTRGMRGQSPIQVEDVFDPGRLYDIFDPRRLGGDAGSGYDIFDPRRIEGEYDIFDPRRLGGGGGGGRSAYLSSRFGGGLAVNSFPPGTPDMQIQQKWEELKQDYYDRKYGGTGLTLPGRDDIVGLG